MIHLLFGNLHGPLLVCTGRAELARVDPADPRSSYQ
jgi:hypothetical protein